jgi:hypothetical protein
LKKISEQLDFVVNTFFQKSDIIMHDPSFDILMLLRIIESFNRYWGLFYKMMNAKTIVSNHHFIQNQLTEKINNHLQVYISLREAHTKLFDYSLIFLVLFLSGSTTY